MPYTDNQENLSHFQGKRQSTEADPEKIRWNSQTMTLTQVI